MIVFWRISNYPSLDGYGAVHHPGRWHSAGKRVVYVADSPAAALVEKLVHLDLTYDDLPDSYTLIKIEAADSVQVEDVAATELPHGWVDDQKISRAFGDQWLRSSRASLLRVPSAILPETFNYLLNPAHRDASRIRVLWHREYPWDRRLLH